MAYEVVEAGQAYGVRPDVRVWQLQLERGVRAIIRKRAVRGKGQHLLCAIHEAVAIACPIHTRMRRAAQVA